MKYDKELMNKMADDLEQYMILLERYMIVSVSNPDEYHKAVKIVKKTIKNLQEGKGDKVFNKENYKRYVDTLENDGYYKDYRDDD